MKVTNILLTIISSQSCVLNKNYFHPCKQLPTPLAWALPRFYRSLPKMSPFWIKGAGRKGLVMSVLYPYSYKNAPGRQEFQAIKCTQSPLLLCGTISFIPMRGANVCWETSVNAVPTLPRAMAPTCPVKAAEVDTP